MRRAAQSKYHAVRTVVDGQWFDSKREAARWQELKLLERAGSVRNLRRQVAFPLHADGGAVVGRYVADFCYFDCYSGNEVVEDVKGVKTPMYRWKAKHLRLEHGIVIRET